MNGLPATVKLKVVQLIKWLLPLGLLGLARRVVRPGVTFKGNYSTWEMALRDSGGYDARGILQKVRDATIKVRNGEAAYERDSVLFYESHYSWPALTGLLKVAAANKNRLRVLDFGGALGSFYFQNRRFFKDLDELRWLVVEQDAFVKCGQELFADQQLRFYFNVDDCLTHERIDVVLLSGVLPYVSCPWKILAQLIDTQIACIIIDLTFVTPSKTDRLTVQKVPPSIYSASYPAYFLSEKKLLAAFHSGGYELVAQFNYPYPVRGIDAVYKGFIYERP